MRNKFLISTKSLLVLSLLFLFSQSCTNLDEELYSELTEANFPTTEEQFISALGATYTSLYGLLNHNSIFSLQQVSSDETMIPQRGGDWFDGGQWIRVHQHNYNDMEEAVNNGWNFLYAGVNNCNRVIDLFDNLVTDGKVAADDANAFIAEVKVLRSLFYFWLLDTYGNVPIVTSFANVENNPASKSRAEVFAFIEGELNENVPLLTDSKDGSTYARFNQSAGKALQAKLYLNAEVYTGTAQWDKCLTACNDIIDSGLFSLESDYFSNFNADNSASVENIFVIPYDEVQAKGFNLPQMTLHYSSQSSFNLQQQPWNGYCSLSEFYNSYEDTDKRKGEAGNPSVRGNFLAGQQFAADGTPLIDASVEEDDPDGESLIFTPVVNALEPNCLRQAGARIGKYEFEAGATPDLNNDFPILRYADILLTKAEALQRSGGSAGDALDLVNEVRSRAGIDALGALDDDELLAERGREMFHEGWRRQDLIRFGKYGGEWDFKPPSDKCKELFPIPANQISANPNLSQNECY